jgi:ABC-type transport system involved in Fe-S cluster assembly fused permease/ATPase subunit
MRTADYKTDTIIQTSLRNELQNDVTLITVAHRLQTIIDADKVVCDSAIRCVGILLKWLLMPRWSWTQVVS